MNDDQVPYHAHVYFTARERDRAKALTTRLRAGPVQFVGRLAEGPVGPHPIPQFEVHFFERDLPEILPVLQDSGLRCLIHPLTDDDFADHTSLAVWIGEPVELDVTTLDPPGRNQGMARFGKTDF